MTLRILKAFSPVLALLTVGSFAILASAAEETAENNAETRMVSSPIYGTYSNFAFYRDDDYGSASITNKTNLNRFAAVGVTGYSQSMSWLGAKSKEKSQLGYYDQLSASGSYSGNDHSFSANPWYIDHSGKLYNSTNAMSGVLESYTVRTDSNGNAWVP